MLAPSSLICFRLVAIDLSASCRSLLPASSLSASASRLMTSVCVPIESLRVAMACCQDRGRFILLDNSVQDLLLPGEDAVQLQVEGGLTHWRLLTAFASRERCNGLMSPYAANGTRHNAVKIARKSHGIPALGRVGNRTKFGR